MAIHDDSTGKHKFGDARARSAVLSAVFIVGLCIGVIASEKIYLNSQESQTPSSAFNPVRLQQDPRALSEVGSTGRSAAVLATNVAEQAGLFQKNREPRNELEMVLQRVAPDGEVIIAISNMNLIHEESLLLWLKVGRAWPYMHLLRVFSISSSVQTSFCMLYSCSLGKQMRLRNIACCGVLPY